MDDGEVLVFLGLTVNAVTYLRRESSVDMPTTLKILQTINYLALQASIFDQTFGAMLGMPYSGPDFTVNTLFTIALCLEGRTGTSKVDACFRLACMLCALASLIIYGAWKQKVLIIHDLICTDAPYALYTGYTLLLFYSYRSEERSHTIFCIFVVLALLCLFASPTTFLPLLAYVFLTTGTISHLFGVLVIFIGLTISLALHLSYQHDVVHQNASNFSIQ